MCQWCVCVCVCRPKDTPFEDGTFKLTIEFTEEYPNKPPTVRFVSKMFHPNGEQSSQTLLVCVFILDALSLSSYDSCYLPGISSLSLAVYADGSICLDILQNRWSPTYDVSSILTSIQVSETLWQLNALFLRSQPYDMYSQYI